MEDIIVIGIDIGSTSIKVGAYRTKPHNNVIEVLQIVNEKYPDDAFERLESHGYHQMNLILVLETIEKCMEKLKYSYRSGARKLGICGQMHGIIFWNENTSNDSIDRYPWSYDPVSERFKVDHKRFSPFITWQDSRCSQNFIRKLITDNYIISGVNEESPTDSCCGQLSSGFGLTTALWFAHNDKVYLSRFNRCGTPMTIILMMLLSINCTLEDLAMLDQAKDRKKILSTMNMESNMSQSYCISDQIAASWGFYNIEKSLWRENSLQRLGLPVKMIDIETGGTRGETPFMLPKIMPAGTYLGSSGSRWLLLPKGVRLYIENGDMQCSARVCLNYRTNAAILNISTSAQIALVLSELPAQELIDIYPALTVVPYLKGKFLLVAASLNGGNVLQKFVESIYDTVRMFAKSETSMQLDDIWNSLLSHKPTNIPSIVITPRIFGERYDPTLTGSITNIKSDNLNMRTIMSSLCHGIVDNLFTMMPLELLRTHQIEQVVCVGSVIQRNSIMRSILEAKFKQLNIRVNFLLTADAQEGAAMISSYDYSD